ncbi:8-oxo-dGTP pyrophosphatase MutT (NUDIX family) [Thermocatellispora tengchongensis]|uniref:8-oxo-dGTP pyrophosphatase MutT (NUDIX family) n=1 Tax=Thermocatellispora tengchongensis TaxID=1073253 RepID=A0A840NQW4_9ACTN|nr:NUDIX hydrolase [Thermocatellispora tengchongensis]MBB5130994.1 8-oxo-dGTP pyrophosphatase MutT (NUDIX family) [Thermocatellispora tengchongensis]
MDVFDAELAAWDRALPRKRVSAGVLFFDGLGRVLLVDPVYKEPWEIPGGTVELDESPRDGAAREVREELGLDRAPGRLLAVDWVGAWAERSEGLAFVYDGGVLSPADVAGIRLQAEELRGYAFVEIDAVAERLIPPSAHRVRSCAAARARGETVELMGGLPVAADRGPR